MPGLSFVERERLGSISAVEGLLATAVRAFESAAEHDGMPAGTLFAVFSDGNPFAPFVDEAMRQFWGDTAACAVHGYCGLSMRSKELPVITVRVDKPGKPEMPAEAVKPLAAKRVEL